MELVFIVKKGETKQGKEYRYLYNEELDKRVFLDKSEWKLYEYINKEGSL